MSNWIKKSPASVHRTADSQKSSLPRARAAGCLAGSRRAFPRVRAHSLAVACGALLAWSASTSAQETPDAQTSKPTEEVEPSEARGEAGGTSAPRAEDGPEKAVESEAANADDADEKPESPLTFGPLELSMFVDAYAAWQTSGKGTLATLSEHRAFSGQGATLRAENGLGLSFLGLDLEYDAGSFGVVGNLRFGQAAVIFHNENDGLFGIEYLTQAYAFYRPIPNLQLDLGMFMSPFGYEALESWKNPNYTISALYVYGQPNWHTGLRATWELDSLTLMAMVVNGGNNVSETQQAAGMNQLPMLGSSVSYQVNDMLSLTLGGLLAMDTKRNDDDGIDGFGDFVATLELGDLTTALNVDYIYTRDGGPSGQHRHFIGGSLTASYRFNDIVGIAARGEYLRDDASFDGHDVWQLVTGTLTLDVEPIPHRNYLVVRWENRWERSNQRIFGQDCQGTEDTANDTYRTTWFETVLGVVVTTNP